MADKFKFALAVLLLVAGVAGFYLLAEQAMILRVLAVLAGAALAAAAAWQTEQGRRFFDFAREASAEARKVVWRNSRNIIGVACCACGPHRTRWRWAVPLAFSLRARRSWEFRCCWRAPSPCFCASACQRRCSAHLLAIP